MQGERGMLHSVRQFWRRSFARPQEPERAALVAIAQLVAAAREMKPEWQRIEIVRKAGGIEFAIIP